MALSTRECKVLHDACGKGHLREVRKILEKGGDVITMLESRIGFLGYTPLHAAVCQNHADILSLLLIYGGDVNAKANGSYTPLHVAASMDYVKCIEVLLKNNADIRALDDFHKTPYRTAIQHGRKDSAKTLKSAEIIQAAKDSPDELRILLNETSVKDITVTCFNDALVGACHVGNFDAVCMLLVAGANNIKPAIGRAINRSHHRVTVLLLMCYAAFNDNLYALENLLDGNSDYSMSEFVEEFLDNLSPKETVVSKIRDCLKNNKEDYTRVAVQLLAETNSMETLRVLLLNTSCRRESRKVNWNKLSLVQIHDSWIDAIMTWVQDLNLSGNKLTSLPEKLDDLKLLVRLNLSSNRLKSVPDTLFCMPCLRDLNISGNAINQLPEISEWRPMLKNLNVSNNNLNTLPQSISRSSLESLNLSRNHFTKVPLVVCEITSLKDLDLSDNREISILPDQMGKLRSLQSLKLRNLDQITDPPEKMRRNAEDLVATLRKKLRSCEPYYKMKLMLVGKGGQGKTTLVHRLKEDYQYKNNDLTQGVEISDITIKRGPFYKEFVFKVWDFGGQEDYYATHQCFLSTMSLYLLVWRLIDGEEGVKGLTPWLDNIAARSPGSTIIIVGTHLDCISPQKHGPHFVDHLKYMVNSLVTKPRYKGKVLVPPQGIVTVSCAFGERRAEISNLRYLIYDTAAALRKGRVPVMGEQIPSSFFSLIERIEKRKMEMLTKKQPPIIRREEFYAMVKENSQQCKKDIEDPHDVWDATVFLRERGIVLHFDDPNEGLNELYFIDPRWLCTLMARVVTVKNSADLVKKGILEVENTKILFKEDIPFDFYPQYIRLMVRFQVAYPLDEARILVPSKLPEKKPEDVTRLLLPFTPIRRVYRIDCQRIHGFWPRFMSRFFFYMKEMIAVDPSRYQKAEDSEHGLSAKFCHSCVRVELGSRICLCFLDDVEWERNDVPEKSEKESDPPSRTKGSKIPQKPASRTSSTKTSQNAGRRASAHLEDDIQALFLDPTVKLFTEEELAGNGSDDEVDNIVINMVTTNIGSSGRCGSIPKKKKSVKKAASVSGVPSHESSNHRCATASKNAPPSASQNSTTLPESESSSTVTDGKPPMSDEKPPMSNERHLQDNEVEKKKSERSEEDMEGKLQHQSSIVSSVSLESEQSEGYTSSMSASEFSSSFRSPTGSFLETDVFPESTRANVGNNTDPNSRIESPVFDGVSATSSVTSENERGQWTGESFDGSGSSFSSRPSDMTDTPLHNHDSQDVSSSKCEGNAESSQVATRMKTAHSDSVDSNDSKLTDNSGIMSLGSADEPSFSLDDASIPKHPATINGGTSTAQDVGTKNDLTGSNQVRDVTESMNDVIDGHANTDEPSSETADPKVSVVGDSTITETPPKDANPALDVVEGKVTNISARVTVAQRKSPDDLRSSKASEKSDITSSSGSYSPFPSRSSTFCSQDSTADQQSLSDSVSVTNTDYDESMKMEDSTTEEPKPEDANHESRSQASDVETEKCTLCKENVPVDQLITIPLDVAELIEKKFLQCWRSGICLNHPDLFLAVSYRHLSDTVLVETAVSPSPLGRRLLTFVVDHLDTLIKEWYPGLLTSFGLEPTIQKLIPCRVCEKNGIPRLHKFTFDSCVTQYSMGNFVKCPRHEVSIQDIAPDIVLHDIDSDLLLTEEEIEYEQTDANKIGTGNFGNVYRGRCRDKDAAIKEYSTSTTEENALKRYCEVRQELNVLRRVGQHPFLVNLIGVCLRPFRLVLELAVEGSLGKTLFNPDFLIERIVVHRIIYQVADALSFLHSLNVIYRDLKPQNILVLSYDEKADINIKVTDFGTATFQFSEGLLAVEGTSGYHAPEMLQEFSKRTGYDTKVDVFSLAMIINGFITRRQPFYNLSSSAAVNYAVSVGRKPEYDDIIAARFGLASLTWLMETCFQFDPSARPRSSAVAGQIRSPPFQLLLGLVALPCPQSVRHMCFVETTRELWIAVDDKATNIVLIYELNEMRLKKKFTINHIRPEDPRLCMQVNCMHVTASAILIGLRGDLDVVTLHDIKTYELKAKIPLEEPVFSVSSNDRYIFLGMSSGDLRAIPLAPDGTPEMVEVTDCQPIRCMVAVHKLLWLMVGKYIHIYHTEKDEEMRAFELHAVRFNSSPSPCSHAVLSYDKTAIWCVSRGDSIVTGWDVNEKQKICEIDCKTILNRLTPDDKSLSPVEASVTCVLPTLDTVWVGTGGGMLLILDAQSGELITWMRLFDDHVRALTLVTGPGPCKTEKCFVVASGKNVVETALSRGGKAVCIIGQERIKKAPSVPSPKKVVEKTKSKAKNQSFYRTKSPTSEGQKSDSEDGGTSTTASAGLLLFFEAAPADVLRRTEAKSI